MKPHHPAHDKPEPAGLLPGWDNQSLDHNSLGIQTHCWSWWRHINWQSIKTLIEPHHWIYLKRYDCQDSYLIVQIFLSYNLCCGSVFIFTLFYTYCVYLKVLNAETRVIKQSWLLHWNISRSSLSVVIWFFLRSIKIEISCLWCRPEVISKRYLGMLRWMSWTGAWTATIFVTMFFLFFYNVPE